MKKILLILLLFVSIKVNAQTEGSTYQDSTLNAGDEISALDVSFTYSVQYFSLWGQELRSPTANEIVIEVKNDNGIITIRKRFTYEIK